MVCNLPQPHQRRQYGDATLGKNRVYITSDGRELPPGKPKEEVQALEPLEAKTDSDEPLTTVEKEPEFPGGKNAMLAYLTNNLKYPAIAVENLVQGMVVLKFIVGKNSSLSDAQIVRDIGNGCGQKPSGWYSPCRNGRRGSKFIAVCKNNGKN